MSAIQRVLDANINRAAEGMRVLEDIARFVLDDEILCSSIKRCRHDLRSATSKCHGSRDTAGDVGTRVSLETEQSRSSIHDIAVASGNRTAEALRVIEEFLKLQIFNNDIESIRYKMYDLSANIIRLLGSPSTRSKQWKLCFVFTVEPCKQPWRELLQDISEAGCDCIQIREKSMRTKELIDHTKEVMSIVPNTTVIVNDRVDVSAAARAHGVHLGKLDMPIEEAREILGKSYIIGSTVRSVEEAHKSVDSGADYLGVGSMFASQTKPATRVVGPTILKQIQNNNYLAIGGITPKNVQELYEVGCKGIAVSSAITQSTTPRKVVEELLQHEVQPA